MGKIFSDLKLGIDVNSAHALKANEDLSGRGVVLHGSGFIIKPEEAANLGLGKVVGLEKHIRPYLNGRDLTGTSRNVMVIDLFGLTEVEVRTKFPDVYQWIYDRVKPERDENRRAGRRENWWIFGEPISTFRPALDGLSRYISTVETAKHRLFVFLDARILPDNKLVNIALDDAFGLGVLSSDVHLVWTAANTSRLGFGNDPVYVKTRCFDPFPFPQASESLKQVVRTLAEDLDAHRKRQQQLHPGLTLTDMYNVLEKLRSGAELTEADRVMYDTGLIGILRELHDSLDRAVFDAYGWPHDLTTEQILQRIVTLNAERRAEEASGLIRWLRPEYQAPNAIPVARTLEGFVEEAPVVGTRRKQSWPTALPDQVRAIKEAMRSSLPQTPKQIASAFRPASHTRVAEILATLTALGQARTDGRRFTL